MSNYDDDQFADADDEENVYMNPSIYRRNVVPMRSAAAMGMYAGGPAYGSSFGRAQAVAAAAAAAQMARRQQVVHQANAWRDTQAANAAGQSMASLGGNGSTWNALNHPTSLSSQLNDVGLLPETAPTVPNPLAASTAATTATGANYPGYPPFYREQKRQQQVQLSEEDDNDGNNDGNEHGGTNDIRNNNAQETDAEQSFPQMQHRLLKSAQPNAKRKSSGPATTTTSRGDIAAEIAVDRILARKKQNTTTASKIRAAAPPTIEIESASSSPDIISQIQKEQEEEEEPASSVSNTQNRISQMKPAPHKRQNRCFMIPDSLERQQVLLATKLVSEEITQGTWMGHKSETRLTLAAVALEQFATEIILPSLESRATNVKYGAASNDRPLFATLLALREVLMLNTAAIFGEDALDILEDDEVDEVKLEGTKQQHDTKKKSEKPGMENDEKKPQKTTSPTSTENHTKEDGTQTEQDSKSISDRSIQASATSPPSANGNTTDNVSKTLSTLDSPAKDATTEKKPAVLNGTVGGKPEEEAKGVDRPQTREEEVFRANLLATGIIFAAIDRLGPPRSEIIASEMEALVEKYDSGHEEFATCLEAADGRVRGVCPDGTPLEKEENVTWRATFNSVRKKHPLFVKQRKRHAFEKTGALSAMIPMNEEGLAHRVTMASPNACHISMVEVAPNDL